MPNLLTAMINPKLIINFTVAAGLLVPAISWPVSTVAQGAKKVEFYCGRTNDVHPATMLSVRGGEQRTIVVWKNKLGKMSPKQRCEAASLRFQAAYEKRSLDRLVAGVDSKTGQGLICATKYQDKQCNSDPKRMLFATNTQQDAQAIVQSLYDSIRRVSNPVSQSSSSTSIDLRELIKSVGN